MSYFIFQGNPDHFEIDTYVEQNEKINWSVRQRKKDIHVGDKVFLWRASGSKKVVSGVIAVAVVTGEPKIMKDEDASRSLWHIEGADGEALRVTLKIEKKCIKPKEVVKKAWLVDDPVLRDLQILKLRTGTNFLISNEQGNRLDDLCRNTGRDWSYEESLAGLWAFKETYGKEVSKLPEKPVAEVALKIGRAISGVYNKVMNFRSIDPNDIRKGFAATNSIDHKVWSDFYLSEKKMLDVEALDIAYQKYWKSGSKVPIQQIEEDVLAEEIEDRGPVKEGALKEYYGKRYERDPSNRKRAIEIHGLSCKVCDFNFEAVYGQRGADFIEVHHRKPIAHFEGEEQAVDPATDLVPVCSNCHRMIHRRADQVLTVEELQEIYLRMKNDQMV